MCGIAGAFGAVDARRLRESALAMRHRGPDDAGEWFSADGRVGLVHCRLSIIDVSPLGHQPMHDPSARTTIVFNGEIYNFRELRRELEARGHTFKGHSDTEVLLALHREHGEAMLPLLNGIFGLAIFDAGTGTLLVACDDMAVKPLYFHEGPNGFAFASELKALVRTGAVDGALDVPVLFRTLAFLWSPGGRTPLKSVSRLGPGEALLVRQGRVERRWRWASETWPAADAGVSAASAIAGTRDRLRTAVERQMVADVPVGAFLSGGLDSSAIVAMAREVNPHIDCFTIDTGRDHDVGVIDDLPFARAAAKHLHVRLHEVRIDSARMAADLEGMVYQLDEPLADPAPLNVLYISRLARGTGIKVLLSGAGGDDIFSGYRRHRALTYERYWAYLPASVRASLRRGATALDRGAAWKRRLGKAFAHADLPAHQRLATYFMWADEERVRRLFAVEHQQILEGERLDGSFEAYLATLPSGLAPLQKMLALEQRFFLADHNLLYTDKMSMAAGVEVRVPFLDRDLVRFANALPARFKQRGRDGKWVLREAMAPYLPREILRRKKTGFGVPLRRWLRQDLREMVSDTLSAETVRRRGLFDPDAVSALVDDDRAGRIDAAYTILALMCIEIWCRNMSEALAHG